MIDKVNT